MVSILYIHPISSADVFYVMMCFRVNEPSVMQANLAPYLTDTTVTSFPVLLICLCSHIAFNHLHTWVPMDSDKFFRLSLF